MIKKILKWKYFVILFFVAVFIIGVCTFKDYGISGDEKIQRNHSLVTHYYLRSVTNRKFMATGNPTFEVNSNIEKLVGNLKVDRRIFKYKYKYYGVAMQIPLTIIEQIFNYSLDISIIYYIRHFYNFLIFFISLIFFYRLLSKYIVKNKKMALLAVLFIILTPRIYGDAFYNNKDLLFMSLTIINFYYCISYLDKSNRKNLCLMTFTSALAINCRVIGGIFIFVACILKLMQNKDSKRKKIKTSLKIFIITYIFYILITPASWNNILLFPFKTLNFFFNYNDPISKKIIKCYYFGHQISSTSLPWHYLPVWIIITTPILYIILSMFGFIKTIIKNIKSKYKTVDKNLLLCNIILISIMLFDMIIRPTSYNGCRHFYFLYPFIIINVIIGLQYLLKNSKRVKKIIILLIFINSSYILYWMVQNHPYQYEYFELIFRKYSVKNFQTNYWKVSNSDAVKYIAEHIDTPVVIYSENDTSDYFLPKKQRDLITLVNTKKGHRDIEYIIDNNSQKTNSYNGYKEINHKIIDGYRLYTIYKKSN